MIRKKHSLQNQLKPYDYHVCLPPSKDQMYSEMTPKPRPKLKLFEMVCLLRCFNYLPFWVYFIKEFNLQTNSTDTVAMFKWPADRWQSSPGNPNHRMLHDNTKRFHKNDHNTKERSQLRLTKFAIRVSTFHRTDER